MNEDEVKEACTDVAKTLRKHTTNVHEGLGILEYVKTGLLLAAFEDAIKLIVVGKPGEKK